MTLKDVLKVSAVLLGLDDVVLVLDEKISEDERTSPIIKRLITVANTVLGELSSSYLPLVYIDEACAYDNAIYLYNLLKKPTKIISVMDYNGNELPFTYDQYGIYVNAEFVQVKYNYVAEVYNIKEEVGFTEKDISQAVLAYGICAEYCLTERRFEEAVMWHQRFIDGVKKRIMPKNVKTPARRWL